jgi:Uma2 family endonuclease
MAVNPQQDPKRIYMTVEEYLAYDRASEIKHEYYDGEVVAMAGGKMAHNSLAGAMYFQLREQLGHRSPCRVYNSDTRVQITKKRYVYPDVVVSCNIADHQDDNDILYSPHLVVEVLSPSTETKDRGIRLVVSGASLRSRIRPDQHSLSACQDSPQD